MTILLINCRADKICKNWNIFQKYKKFIISFSSFLLILFKLLPYNYLNANLLIYSDIITKIIYYLLKKVLFVFFFSNGVILVRLTL